MKAFESKGFRRAMRKMRRTISFQHGIVCSQCGRTVSRYEDSKGESTCCDAPVIHAEDFTVDDFDLSPAGPMAASPALPLAIHAALAHVGGAVLNAILTVAVVTVVLLALHAVKRAALR